MTTIMIITVIIIIIMIVIIIDKIIIVFIVIEEINTEGFLVIGPGLQFGRGVRQEGGEEGRQ